MAVLIVIAACGTSSTPAERCAAICGGCCTADGRCEPGNAPAACGVGGAACSSCQGADQCLLGTCVPVAAPGGGNEGDAGTPPEADAGPDAGDAPDAGAVTDAGVTADAGVTTDAGAQVDAGTRVDAGLPCAPGCPAGYACDGTGTCTGQGPLIIDVPVAYLAVGLTANGATPQWGCQGFDTAEGYLQATSGTETALHDIPCFSAYQRRIAVRPGSTWTIDYRNLESPNLPSVARLGTVTAGAAGTTTTLDRDVQSRAVTGTLRANGAPIACTATTWPATLYFHANDGTHYPANTSCTGGAAVFSLRLPDGLYQPFVMAGYNTTSELPDVPIATTSTVTVGPATAPLTLDVTTFLSTFQVRLNGQTPTDDCASSPSAPRFALELEDLEDMMNWSTVDSSCTTGSYSVTRRIGAGRFRVILRTTRVNVPDAAEAVVNVTGPGPVVVDVPGTRITGMIRVNGVLPSCGAPRFSLERPGTFFNPRLAVSCPSGPGSFSGWVSPGAYRLGLDAAPFVPEGVSWVTGLSVGAAPVGLPIVFNTVSVPVRLTVNGSPPTGACVGQGAQVILTTQPDGPSSGRMFPCPLTANQQPINVIPGPHEVTAYGVFGSATNLPNIYEAGTRNISGGTLDVDVPSRLVTGSLLINGAPPTGCTSSAVSATYVKLGKMALAVTCTSNGGLQFSGYAAAGRWEASVATSSWTGTLLPFGTRPVIGPLRIP